MSLTYKDAGVDIAAGSELVERIKPLAQATRRAEVLSGLGGFAGLCAVPTGYREPVLVSGTDGVGTKLKTAFASGRHDTVGIDLVAMCVNDVIVTGAEPLFFLDYFACGKLDTDVAAAVIGGIAAGCKQAGCALIGGETAELPGLYATSEYDLAGFCVGVAERESLSTPIPLSSGDTVIGLPSSGLHSNGHSLARRALLDELGLGLDETPTVLRGASIADVLLEPTRIYWPQFVALKHAGVSWKAACHITGGGLVENPPRMLRDDTLSIVLDPSAWPRPAIFDLIASAGVDEPEMRRTFNLGIGMLIVVPAPDTDRALAAIDADMPGANVIGRLIERGDHGPVVFGEAA